MKYPSAWAKKLVKLVEEKSLNGSEFKNQRLLQELEEFGVVSVSVKRHKTKIYLQSKDKLDILLANQYDIPDLNKYIDVIENKNRTRGEVVSVTGDSKNLKTEVQSGLYIASYEKIKIKVNSQDMMLFTTDMSSFFVHKNAKLEFSKDVLVVGVENFENILYIQKQKKLFDDGRQKIFVWRNEHARKFLSECVNDYLHFGDLDLAGINIYINEIIPRIPHNRYEFYIPQKVLELLKRGNSEDYFTHLKKYPNLKSDEKYLQDFIDLLHRVKRSLHQEFLIEV